MAFAPLLGLVGGVVSAFGTIQQGRAQAAALNYQAQVAQNNAIIAQQNAQYAIEAGQQKAAARSLQEAETLGAIKVAQAASGIDVNTGSAKNVQVSQREIGSLDTATELHNAQLTAYGYKTQATNYQAQAGLYSFEAPQAVQGAEIGALGQVFGAASKWYATPTGGSSGFNLFG